MSWPAAGHPVGLSQGAVTTAGRPELRGQVCPGSEMPVMCCFDQVSCLQRLVLTLGDFTSPHPDRPGSSGVSNGVATYPGLIDKHTAYMMGFAHATSHHPAQC